MPGRREWCGPSMAPDQHNARFCAFKLLTAEREQAAMHLWYRWAGRPAVAGGSVHHVQAVSSRVTSSPPSRCRAARSPAPTTCFTTVPGTQKALSLPGKGPDLRKLVAGRDLNPPPLGYEPYDIGLCRLRQSLAGAVTSTDRTDPISLCRVHLLRLKLSRRVRFTNRFTEQAIDLHFPAPSAPFRGCRPWGAALLPASPSDCQAARPRHATRRFRSCPTPGRTAPSRHHRYRVCTGAPTHHCVSRPLPRTRLLPDLTADGFCQGAAQPITQ